MNDLQSLLVEPFDRDIKLDMPWEAYLETPGFNPSRLTQGLKSMCALRHACDPQDEKPNRGKLIGSAAHCLILEPGVAQDRIAVYSGKKNRSSNEYKEFADEYAGCLLMRADEYDTAQYIAAAVLGDPVAVPYLKRAKIRESSLFLDDCGIQCKGRVDAWGQGLLLDLKTTTDVTPRVFGNLFARLKYAEKLACYWRWLGKLLADGGQYGAIEDVAIIAVEQSPPYDVVVSPVPEVVLENAWDELETRVISRLRDCIEQNYWPGVAEGKPVPLNIPNWSMEIDFDV